MGDKGKSREHCEARMAVIQMGDAGGCDLGDSRGGGEQ